MTVSELIKQLQEIENQQARVCVPDYSACTCNARDGEYQARTVKVIGGTNQRPWTRVVIE